MFVSLAMTSETIRYICSSASTFYRCSVSDFSLFVNGVSVQRMILFFVQSVYSERVHDIHRLHFVNPYLLVSLQMRAIAYIISLDGYQFKILDSVFLKIWIDGEFEILAANPFTVTSFMLLPALPCFVESGADILNVRMDVDDPVNRSDAQICHRSKTNVVYS